MSGSRRSPRRSPRGSQGSGRGSKRGSRGSGRRAPGGFGAPAPSAPPGPEAWDRNLEEKVPAGVNQQPKVQDKMWTYAFVLLWVIAIGAVGAAYAMSSENYTILYRDVLQGQGGRVAALIAELLLQALPYFAIAFFVSIAAGFGLVRLMAAAPKGFVYTSLFFVPVLCFLGAGAAMVFLDSPGNLYMAVMLVIVGIIPIICFFCLKSRIDLAVKVLDVAATMLKDRNGFVGVTVLLTIVFLFPTGILSWGISRAYLVGDWINEGNGNWSFQQNSVGQVLYGVIGIAAAMTGNVLLYLNLATIIGGVTTLYFSPNPEGEKDVVWNSAKRAIKNSFGSLVFAAFVLLMVQIMREAIRKAQSQQSGGALIAAIIIGCILNLIGNIILFLTKWAIVMVAITGQSFCDSAKAGFNLLRRNFLSAVVVDYVISICTGLSSFVLSLFIAGLCYLVSQAGLAGSVPDPQDRMIGAIIVAVISWYIALFVLFFFADIIQQATTGVFAGYAIDKDNAQIAPNPVAQSTHQAYDQFAVVGEDEFKKGYPAGAFK